MRGAMVPRRISRAVLLLGLALSGVFATATPCLACTCLVSTPKESLGRADAAFVGRVVNDVMTEDGTTQTFEVDQVFKGTLGSTIDVWAQIGTGVVNSCAILFPTGDRVAVLLFEDDRGRWSARACDQVTEAELRRVGGPPQEPAEIADREPSGIADGQTDRAAPAEDLGRVVDGGGMPEWAVIALGAALALASVATHVVWAGRRDRRAAYPSGWDPVDVDGSQEVES